MVYARKAMGADSELVYRLELRYFEDCEGQRLDLRLRTPGGYDGSLLDTWIYLP